MSDDVKIRRHGVSYPPEQMLSISDCSKKYGVSRDTVYADLERDNVLREYRNGKGQVYVHVDEAEMLYGIRLVTREVKRCSA